MASIKRYVPKIVLWGHPGIFRAIKVTDNNHHTIQLFAGNQVSFREVKQQNKSVLVIKEQVIGKTPNNHLKSAKNGDYIARQYDGKFILLSGAEFERLYQQTHILIADQDNV